MAMLDWLRFFPYARDSGDAPKATEIRGPYCRKPRPNQWRFGDCVLHFKAPWANPIIGFDGNGCTVAGVSPKRGNILMADLQRVYGNSDSPLGEWNFDRFYQNSWYFVGPWFTGYEACLEAHAILCSARQNSAFETLNLFHPRVLESAITNELDNAYGYKRSGKKPHFRGPFNWHVLPLSPTIQGVTCDIHFIANGSRDNPEIRRLIFIPITPNQFIRISFNFGGPNFHDEMRYKPMLELCNSIIDSMHLEVGPETQAEWDKVKATCPDMSLTDTFAELPWPLFKEKPDKKPREIDITQAPRPNVISDQSNHQDKKG